MKKKINLGILFGGQSCEHEVSVTSARSIEKAIDREKYHVHLIGIDKSGYWQLGDDVEALTSSGSVTQLQQGQNNPDTAVSLELHSSGNLVAQTGSTMQSHAPAQPPMLDVVFPILHGPFGEDGTMQGVLETAGLPYVGCGVAASALAMDKVLAKLVFAASGISQAPYMIAETVEWQQNQNRIIDLVEQKLEYPMFVKPANMGSSVGISKAGDRHGLIDAASLAFQFDNKVVIENSMENCREIECSVLGNEYPQASVPGEIIPGAEFYDYHTKYIDDKSQLVIPAPLDDETTRRVQSLAIEAFRAIDGRGLARVDFFVNRSTNAVILNEVNTMPGFTPISMYPKLWAASGIAYEDLIDKLIELAITHFESKQSLKRTF